MSIKSASVRILFPIAVLLGVGCSTPSAREDLTARNPAAGCPFDRLYPNWRNELLMYHFYVGQGSSTFIRTPSGTTVLIDAGLPGSGTKVILPVLQGCGVTKLDYAVISHPHVDHFGGFGNFASVGFKVGTFYIATEDNDNPPGATGAWRTLLTNIKAISSKTAVPELGTASIKDKDVKFEIVAVNGLVATKSGKPKQLDIYKNPHQLLDCNAASIAMVIHYKKFDYWEGGDLTSGGAGTKKGPPVEEAVAPVVGHVDVYHSNHHGSDTSNSDILLKALTPTYTIISAGLLSTNGDISKTNAKGELQDNPLGFHLPNVASLNRIHASGSKTIYMTSKGETENVLPDGRRLPVDILKDKSVKANILDADQNDIMLVTDGTKFGFYGPTIKRSDSGPFNASAR